MKASPIDLAAMQALRADAGPPPIGVQYGTSKQAVMLMEHGRVVKRRALEAGLGMIEII